MTVADLIELLRGYPQDKTVLIESPDRAFTYHYPYAGQHFSQSDVVIIQVGIAGKP